MNVNAATPTISTTSIHKMISSAVKKTLKGGGNKQVATPKSGGLAGQVSSSTNSNEKTAQDLIKEAQKAYEDQTKLQLESQMESLKATTKSKILDTIMETLKAIANRL